MAVLLRANGPLDLNATLDSGQVFRWERGPDCWSGVVGRNVWRVSATNGGVKFESSPANADQLADEARRYFRLDDDLNGFYERMEGDPWVTRAIDCYRGLRLIRQDPWECLVAFIVSSFSNIKRIRHHMEQLSRVFGDPVNVRNERWYSFPTVERLAEVAESDFRRLGLGYRSRFLAALPKMLIEKEVDLWSLRGTSYPTAKEALLRIYGVGEKVADCVLAFALDKGEAFPIDVWVRRVLLRWYHPGRKLTDRELRVWALREFGQDGAYAQQYLFHSMRLDGPQGLATSHVCEGST